MTITILVLLLLLAGVLAIVKLIPLDQPWKNIAYAAVALIFLIAVVRHFGIALP